MGPTKPTAVTGEPADWILGIAERQDRACFIALFHHYAPRVKGYLLRQGVEDRVADELAQDTLLTVWRKAAQFDPERASAGAWIYTIARNRRVDTLRHDRHPGDVPIGEHPADPLTPEQALGVSEGEHRVHRAIAKLSSEQATVLRLAFFEDRTHAEIAGLLGVPLGTVKSRIRLASAHLRAALEQFV